MEGLKMTNSMIRRKLFRNYSKNLSLYRPELVGRFLCPICLEEFSDPSQIALAHVIPDAMGGRLTTLSCNRCDSEIGHKYNRHLVKEKEHFDDFEKPSQAYVTFQPKGNRGIKVIADLAGLREPRPHIKCYPTSKMPKEIYRDYFSESGPGNALEFSLGFSRESIDLRKRNLSLIHSSFLMMFYQFGYEYILSECADYMREAIIGKNKFINFKNAINFINWGSISKPFSLPTMAVTKISTNLFFLSTLIPFNNELGYIVHLPCFGNGGVTAYENLLHTDTYHCDTKIIPNNILCKNLNKSEARGLGNQIVDEIIAQAFNSIS